MRQRSRIHFKRRLFRSLFWCAALPVLLVIARFAWSGEAAARLAAERDRVRGLGIPVLPRDWPDPAKVPPSDDALVPFRAAIAGITLSEEERKLLSDVPSPAPTEVVWNAQQTGAIKQLWARHQLAITELDLAAGHATAAWPVDLDVFYGHSADDDRSWTSYRTNHLEDLLTQMTIVFGTEHRWPDFFSNLHRLFVVGHILDQSTRSWDQSSATFTRNRALRVLERFEPEINWSDAAVADSARQLLNDLLPISDSDMTRAWNVHILNAQWEIHRQEWRSQWWLTPLLDDDEARQLAAYAALAPAARAVSWPQFQSRMLSAPTAPPSATPPPSSRLTDIARLFSGEPEIEYQGRTHFQGVATLRAFSILLAAHLYQHDNGQLPASAELLTPRYLAALPLDPFDASNKPMRYRLDAAGPTLWSIGEDGVDNGGKSFPSNSGMARFRGPDIVFGAAWRDLLITKP